MKTEKINKRAISIYPEQEGFALLMGAGNLSKGLQCSMTALRMMLYRAAVNLEIEERDFDVLEQIYRKDEYKLMDVIRAARNGYDLNLGACICEHFGVNRASEMPTSELQEITGRFIRMGQLECLTLLVMLQTLKSLRHENILGSPWSDRIKKDGFRHAYRGLASVAFYWGLEKADFI